MFLLPAGWRPQITGLKIGISNKMGEKAAQKLGGLLTRIGVDPLAEWADLAVCRLTDDSRQVGPGTLFVAVKGEVVDGHDFIADAISCDCVAVLVDGPFTSELAVPVIEVADTRSILGELAAAFYGQPADRMTIIGVTGTNGKTTTTYLLEEIISHCGGSTGVIGTVAVRFAGHAEDSVLTTPGAIDLQRILADMADQGVTHVVMEVSSHALVQQRLKGMLFDIALFTNLSRDHLDFHQDMGRYFAAKKELFTDYLKEKGVAVVVLGSATGGKHLDRQQRNWGMTLADDLEKETACSVITCGLDQGMIRTAGFTIGLQGINGRIVTPRGEMEFASPLTGEFNLFNIVGAVGAGAALGFDLQEISQGIAALKNIPGRLERVPPAHGPVKAEEQPVIFVDYAHTPAALAAVLVSVAKLQPRRLILVFGCGGDRDKGKRAQMGEVAAMADYLILTSDNPRSENPARILADIEEGVSDLPRLNGLGEGGMVRGYEVIESRRQAIGRAIRVAGSGDVVLICGKGHETYQLIGRDRLFFDDRQEARAELVRLYQAA